MKNLIKNFVIIVASLLLVAALLSFSSLTSEKPEEVGLSALVQKVNNEEVKEVVVEGDILHVTLNDVNAKPLQVKKELGQSFTELLSDYGVAQDKLAKVNVIIKEESGFDHWMSILLPIILPILLIVGIIYFMTRQVQGVNNKAMGFGQTQAKQAKPDDKNKKTFKDIAGAKEAKNEVEEIVDFLKDPKKFTDMGAKIPKGLLLMGAPGTGKTLLAKAIAGEAGVPFFHISGSEFVEMFVGVGASRVRDLFNKAKKAAPAIVFIDEIDAVGRKRGAGLGGSHDEREQTLNQILVEMDGFEPNLGVIVVAATNRPDVLDSALLRPGRFDRRVVIDMPDINDREEILIVHASNKPIGKDVSIHKLAERTPGFSGADLENLLNEAAILTVRREKKIIGESEILESIEKVLLGPEKRSKVMTEKDREMTAYHEAGHAIVGHFLKNCDPVRKVSIIGRGMAGGYTLSMPEKDEYYKTLAKFRDDVAMILGGYATEKLIYGDDQLSTGPSSDLKKATQMARAMVVKYGMSEKLGPRQFGENEEMIFLAQEIHEKKNYSEKVAEVIDAEIDRILDEALQTSVRIIKEHRKQMDELVKHLMEKETIEQEEFRRVMNDGVEEKKDVVVEV
ncbi:MAG TPA: cell division protein FtsH [Candidatus Magasanikbacteria bacterium]|nr:cell division protein FtsH [Candidatus Magasanikbacteria bacterium]